jgi:putative transcriptional regulator
MDQKLFAELLESANEALEHARGKRELRTTELPPAPRPVDGRGIKRLRARLKMSQAVFARYLNVSTKLVQAWEADRRQPDGPALLLVRLVERNPAVVLSSWTLVKGGRARVKGNPRSLRRARRTRQTA